MKYGKYRNAVPTTEKSMV